MGFFEGNSCHFRNELYMAEVTIECTFGCQKPQTAITHGLGYGRGRIFVCHPVVGWRVCHWNEKNLKDMTDLYVLWILMSVVLRKQRKQLIKADKSWNVTPQYTMKILTILGWYSGRPWTRLNAFFFFLRSRPLEYGQWKCVLWQVSFSSTHFDFSNKSYPFAFRTLYSSTNAKPCPLFQWKIFI